MVMNGQGVLRDLLDGGVVFMREHRGLVTSILVSTIVVVVLIAIAISARTQAGSFVWKTWHADELALRLNPDPDLALEIGEYYFNVGNNGDYDLDRAGQYFKQAILLTPDGNKPATRVWHQLARVEFIRGNFRKALKAANTQIALFGSEIPNIYYVRGLIYGYMGAYKNAEYDFSEYLVHNPTA